MVPGDRLICALVKSLKTGDKFKIWPLHVTIIPWFRLDLGTSGLVQTIAGQVKSIKPFEALIGQEDTFGNGKTANLINLPSPFTDIESKIRRILKSEHAWLVDETTKRQWEYQPHVTVQKTERLNIGDKFYCDKLYIIS